MPRALTALRLRALDVLERDPLVPPRRLQFVGEGDFAATGDEFLGHLRDLAGLRLDSAVLDVGSGIGRLARPLAGFLSADGTYAGFDVSPVGVGWCQARYPSSFRFDRVDLLNARYNPTGTEAAREFRFPYDDDAFDVVVAASVLTHLLEEEAAHYLAEMRRVLRPEGRALVTFFCLDDASRAAIAGGTAALAFLDPEGMVAVVSDEVPEDAVAYDVRWVRARVPAVDIHHGTWRGADGPSFQDLVVFGA